MICWGLHLALLARSIPQRFQDGKWIALALFASMQVLLVTVPTLAAVYFSSTGRFAVLSFGVFAQNLSILLMVFVPKMHAVATGWVGENSFDTFRESMKKKAAVTDNPRSSNTVELHNNSVAPTSVVLAMPTALSVDSVVSSKE